MSPPRHNTYPQRSLKAFLDVVRHAIRMFWDGTVAGISFAFAFPSYGEDFTAAYMEVAMPNALGLSVSHNGTVYPPMYELHGAKVRLAVLPTAIVRFNSVNYHDVYKAQVVVAFSDNQR
jgi:hypothetical protein